MLALALVPLVQVPVLAPLVLALALLLVEEVVAERLLSSPRKRQELKHKLREKLHKLYISFLFLVS